MSLNHAGHNAHMAAKATEEIGKTSNPLKGAGWGAIAAGAGSTGTLALFGLALTPVGWAVALGVGAAAGAAYVAGKNKGKGT